MRKKFLAILIVAVATTFVGYNIYQSQRTEFMSDIMLANVEALAGSESGGGRSCYSTYKSADWFHSDYTFTYCYSCTPRKGHDLMDKGSC